MSRAGSQIGDDNNNVIAPIDENKITLLYEDLEQLVRARNRAIRQTRQLNQRAPVAQNGAGARQPLPPQPPQLPIHRRPEDDEEYYYEPTMKELSAPDFQNQPWCIDEGPELAEIEIKTAVVHHLPKFSGRQGESATKHLQSFHGICQTLRPYGVSVEDFKLKAFHFSLTNAANAWFLSLPPGSIRTWDQMQKKFLAKYYPATNVMQVHKQLQVIRQGPNESMYDYLEKFNAQEQSCCNLGVPEKLIIEYLLDGLRPLDRMLLDASAGATIMNLSPAGVRNLIAEVAENARFREEASGQEEFSRTRSVAKAETPSNQVTEELKQMREMMQKLIMKQSVQVKPCEFCGATNHKTDACPSLQEDTPANVNAVGEFQHYNNHAPRQPQQQYYCPPYRQHQGSYNNQNYVKELAASTQHLAQAVSKTDGDIAELSKQMSQIAQTVSELKRDPRRLPS
ncbi:unnamed protein product [Rhodiola kirilowii]